MAINAGAINRYAADPCSESPTLIFRTAGTGFVRMRITTRKPGSTPRYKTFRGITTVCGWTCHLQSQATILEEGEGNTNLHEFTLPSMPANTVIYYTLEIRQPDLTWSTITPCYRFQYPPCPTDVGSVKARSLSSANLTDGTLMPLNSPLLFGNPTQGPSSNRLRVFGAGNWGLYFYGSVVAAFQSANFRFRIRYDATSATVAETTSGLLNVLPIPQIANVTASGKFTTGPGTHLFSIFCTRIAGTGFLRWRNNLHEGGFAIIKDPQF